MILFTKFFEKSYLYGIYKLSHFLTINDDLNDYTFVIIATKQHYVVFYSLRLGNILYMSFSDWGVYIQLFFYEFCNGVSLYSKWIFQPLFKIFKKQKNKMIFFDYITKRNMTNSTMREPSTVQAITLPKKKITLFKCKTPK